MTIRTAPSSARPRRCERWRRGGPEIPAGVQPGATLLAAKRGVPKLGQPNVRGDQYVTVEVTIPKQVWERRRSSSKLDKAMTN